MMGVERKICGGKIWGVGLLVLLLCVLTPSISQAQVVVNDPAPGYRVSQVFQMRTPTRPHRGNDIAVPCGTVLPTQAPVNCLPPDPQGYGNQASVSLGCEVTMLYAHLTVCVSGQSQVTTGGAPGSPGAGNSEGCHLHYEVRIAGSAVDPQRAYGQNLCDPAVRQDLISNAQSVLGSYAGGGGGATGGQTTGSGTSTTPPPTVTPVIVSVIYIPGGTVINPGAGYYEVTHVNGRVERIIDLRGEGVTLAQMPPTIENFVLTSPTSNPELVTGCATDTWTAMVNQSVLQTRREMAINERYVVKPDSVMAYSCLSEQLMQVGQGAGVFSESQLWANRQVDLLDGFSQTVTIDMGRNSLDGAINNVAREPYEYFLQSVFSHDFLAGQAPGLIGSGDGDEDGNSQAGTTCGAMSQVWRIAKCMNVTDDPMFPTFEQMIGTDPRRFPPNLRCSDTGITQNMIDIARGRDIQRDPITTHLTMMNGTECHPPIATGITVERQEGASQITTRRRAADGLCITAGCSYQNTGVGPGYCEVSQPDQGPFANGR